MLPRDLGWRLDGALKFCLHQALGFFMVCSLHLPRHPFHHFLRQPKLEGRRWVQWWELIFGKGGGRPENPTPHPHFPVFLEVGIVWLVNYTHSLDISNSLQSGSSLTCGLTIL